MTLEQLRLRCNRIIGLSPDSPERPVDCVKLLDNLNRHSRAIAAEMLARELAEFVHEHERAFDIHSPEGK